MNNEAEVWPNGWLFSMAPWGYTVSVERTDMTETGVTYQCKGRIENSSAPCSFAISVDPRDMTPDNARQLLRWHIDQSH